MSRVFDLSGKGRRRKRFVSIKLNAVSQGGERVRSPDLLVSLLQFKLIEIENREF